MSNFEPCPSCEKQEAARVRFTAWGGVIGPRLFSLVKCHGCGEQYNGRNGRRVKRAIRVYTWVTLGLLAVMAACAIYALAGGEGRPAGTGRAGAVNVVG